MDTNNGFHTVIANHADFRFRGFRSGNFNGKDALRCGRPIDENIDKITEIVKSNRHVRTNVRINTIIITKCMLNKTIAIYCKNNGFLFTRPIK